MKWTKGCERKHLLSIFFMTSFYAALGIYVSLLLPVRPEFISKKEEIYPSDRVILVFIGLREVRGPGFKRRKSEVPIEKRWLCLVWSR